MIQSQIYTYCTFFASGIKSKNITLTSLISLLHILSFLDTIPTSTFSPTLMLCQEKKLYKYSVTIIVQTCIMLSVFPNVCYLFSQFSEKTIHTWKTFLKQIQKTISTKYQCSLSLSKANSAHLSADAQISPDFDQFRS